MSGKANLSQRLNLVEDSVIFRGVIRRRSGECQTRGRPRALLFKLIQVGVRCGIAQYTAHGDDLTFVMEGMGQSNCVGWALRSTGMLIGPDRITSHLKLGISSEYAWRARARRSPFTLRRNRVVKGRPRWVLRAADPAKFGSKSLLLPHFSPVTPG